LQTVPIAAEVLKKAGKFDPKKLFGVTTLDVVRAARFLSEVDGTATPDECPVTVVGGHSGVTIVPLLSQTQGESCIYTIRVEIDHLVLAGKSLSPDSEKWKALVNRIQFGGDEVVKAKDGAGSATLSMAYGMFAAQPNAKPSVLTGLGSCGQVHQPAPPRNRW
jgi:malate dehydrogenase